MQSDAFPFFQWIEQSLVGIFNTIYVGFLYIFGFLARICEILLLPFQAAAERSVALLGWFFSDGFELVATRVFQTLGDFFYTLTGWGWDQFARVIGLVLLWLDDTLPDALSLDITGLLLTVAYIKAATSWFNVGLFFTTIGAGLTMIWGIALAKIIWRSIPTIG